MNDITIICNHNTEVFLKDVKGFDVSSNPFLSYAFLSVYLKYYPKGNFYFFNIYERGRLIAIIPMECTVDSRLMNLKYFRFIGYRQFNYEQYICNDDNIKRVHCIFIDYLEKQSYCSIINYYDINNSSLLYKVLSNETHKKKQLSLYQCPCLRFTNNFDDFFKEVYPASKKRTELKKFQKKLAEVGDFRIINISNHKLYQNYKQYIDQIYRVHAERFAKVYATSFFGSPKMRPYYSELIESLLKYEKGYISLLLMDEVVIAFIFCLTNGETLIDWIPAFDPAFSKYSLGIVQYKMLFEEMCAPSVPYKVFDYSKGSSVYKRKWAKEETINYQFIIQTSKQNLISQIVYYFEKTKFSFKCYLREKGVLEMVKDKLGMFLSHFKDNNKINGKVETSIIEASAPTFHYSDYITYPVEVRRNILDSMYQGAKLVDITLQNGIISIKMSKS